MSAQVAADLRAAAEVLRRDGWTQGEYRDDRGCCCVLGAISAAITGGRVADTMKLGYDDCTRAFEAIPLVEEVVGRHGYDGIDGWNDAPGRTADEVIAALLAAADAAEAQP